MTFSSAAAHQRALRDGVEGYGTIEVGRMSTRRGIVVQVDGCTSSQVMRHVVEQAFDFAGRQGTLRVSDPGWWALLIGWAGLRTTGAASIQRIHAPGARHGVLVVEPARLIEEHPPWPLLRLRPDGPWIDCRGETALRHGPSDAELVDYLHAIGSQLTVEAARSMFTQGVVEWGELPASGRRRIVGAGMRDA